MDLGFGSHNQQLGNLAQSALQHQATAQESALDSALDQYDALLDDTETLAALRRERLQHLQQRQRDAQQWRAAGHGVYAELQSSQQQAVDTARAFFDATKQSERLVVHFYRPSTAYCDVFHKHLTTLAARHLETKFVKVNVQDCDVSEKGASFLVQRLGIVVMPTLVLIHKRQVVHHVVGFDELGGDADFTVGRLGKLLRQYNVLFESEDEDDEEEEEEEYGQNRGGWKGVNSIRVERGSRFGRSQDDGEDF